MRSMNCRSVRHEIDEAAPGDSLSAVASEHVKSCLECAIFSEERLKLRRLVSSLGTVEAPGDFEFRLRARLAGEKRGSAQRFSMFNLPFGIRSAALAMLLLTIGATIVFVELRSSSDNAQLANKATTPPSKTIISANEANGGQQNAAPAAPLDALAPQATTPAATIKFVAAGQRANANRDKARLGVVASMRDNSPVKTRDLSSTGAPVLKRMDQLDVYPTYAVPVDDAYQSLKVSLDDGRGSSRTISLPSVSFGSQRVLSQGISPVLASARGSW